MKNVVRERGRPIQDHLYRSHYFVININNHLKGITKVLLQLTLVLSTKRYKGLKTACFQLMQGRKKKKKNQKIINSNPCSSAFSKQ